MSTTTSEPAFRVECPKCDVESESNEFERVASFVSKHHKHTNHTMVCTRSEFEDSIEPHTKWKISCPQCVTEWEFETIDQAEEFQQEHSQYTDHEIKEEPTKVIKDKNKDDIEVTDIKATVATLADRCEGGAPEQAVCAVLTENGRNITSIMLEIDKLRRKGEIYEPRKGHLMTT